MNTGILDPNALHALRRAMHFFVGPWEDKEKIKMILAEVDENALPLEEFCYYDGETLDASAENIELANKAIRLLFGLILWGAKIPKEALEAAEFLLRPHDAMLSSLIEPKTKMLLERLRDVEVPDITREVSTASFAGTCEILREAACEIMQRIEIFPLCDLRRLKEELEA